jgi:hypothetical protein
MRKIVAYVKDEGANLNTMTTSLKFVLNFEIVSMEENFQGTCFGHAFFKGCQYETIEKKFIKT